MHHLDSLHLFHCIACHFTQLGPRNLAGEQGHAVVAHHIEAGLAFLVGVSLGDIDAGFGFDQLVIDTATQSAGAVIVIDGVLPGRSQHATAASQGHRQDHGGQADHSSLPNSCRSIRSHRQWIANRWTSWIRAVERAGTRISTSSGSSSDAMPPPSRPVSATTSMSRSWAAWMACRTLPELPLVEIASSTSPGCPRARICLEKTSS